MKKKVTRLTFRIITTYELADHEIMGIAGKFDSVYGGGLGVASAGLVKSEVIDGPEDEPEPEPEEGDLITYDGGRRFYEVGKHSCFQVRLGRGFVLEVEEDKYMLTALRRHFNELGFWPNVWDCNDHGNLTLIAYGGRNHEAT